MSSIAYEINNLNTEYQNGKKRIEELENEIASISSNSSSYDVDVLKYKDKLNWDKVCIHQKMSEDFMIDHEELLNWKSVWYCQDFSDYFYSRYESHLKYYKENQS